MIRKYNLKGEFYYDFKETGYRLLLLPSDVLTNLTLYCGIAIYHNEIKTVIDKTQKEIIIDSIGVNGYRFAIDSASLLVGNFQSKLKLKYGWGDLAYFLRKCGTNLFLSAFKNIPEYIYRRIQLKFDKEVVDDEVFPEYDIEPLKIMVFFIRIMKQIVDRQWQQIVL